MHGSVCVCALLMSVSIERLSMLMGPLDARHLLFFLTYNKLGARYLVVVFNFQISLFYCRRIFTEALD